MTNIGKKEFIEPAKVAAIKFIERHGICPPVDLYKLTKKLRMDIHYITLPANCDGLTLELNPNPLNVKYIICVNKHKFKMRQRFTIAHEIGHIVLNHCDRSPNAPLFKHFQITLKDNFEFERDADIFASELLMPTPHLLKLIKIDKAKDIKRLSDFYQVSKQAMEIKLEEIKRVMQ